MKTILLWSWTLVFCGNLVAQSPDNLAYGKSARSNNHIYEFTADKAVDGDPLSYWEGAADAYPNQLTVDLGTVRPVDRIVLRLNPKRIWGARTQTIEVQTSTDGEAFTTAVAAQDWDFDPVASGNAVTLPVRASLRSLRLVFTANTEATAGQLAELEVFGP